MTKYKPCPFCGSKLIKCENLYIEDWVTGCQSCYASTKTYRTKKESVEAWNTRVEG